MMSIISRLDSHCLPDIGAFVSASPSFFPPSISLVIVPSVLSVNRRKLTLEPKFSLSKCFIVDGCQASIPVPDWHWNSSFKYEHAGSENYYLYYSVGIKSILLIAECLSKPSFDYGRRQPEHVSRSAIRNVSLWSSSSPHPLPTWVHYALFLLPSLLLSLNRSFFFVPN